MPHSVQRIWKKLVFPWVDFSAALRPPQESETRLPQAQVVEKLNTLVWSSDIPQFATHLPQFPQ
ncbi:MAG: hypothetical protein M1283_01545 [Gammaproteobacteria bacterium]|nr:hypothetical protein [Gammaproteobacteria bacterium]